MSSKKRKRGKKPFNGRLAAHKKIGTNLISPINQIQKLSYSSWMNNRLPCMIWASLLINKLGRLEALDILRGIGLHVGELFRKSEIKTSNIPRIGLYGLSNLDDFLQERFFESLFIDDQVADALRPLLLIETLPGRDLWAEHIGDGGNDEYSWTNLADAVANLLDHQSLHSTDCRWAYILPIVYSGKMHLQNEDQYKEYFEYPNFGDISRVMPQIRAGEINTGDGMMDDDYASGKRRWANHFWTECKQKTECCYPQKLENEITYDVVTTISETHSLWRQLSVHFAATDKLTHVQAKRDASFGFCFYAITLAQEGLASSGKLITAKLTLRMLSEVFITFKYLIVAGDEKLWDVYRTHGSGQAKLQLLKMTEVLENAPGYIKKEHIEGLANEDMYMDFQNINLGNWAKIDLRKMSQIANCKNEYDKYYTWPSSFVHGQWCAVRDTVFDTCYNPLHRLHRIPRPGPRYQEGAEEDIVSLLNKILELLDGIYPKFNPRLKLQKVKS
ncbi:DUF5677 domain-containing protein [Glaciecola sp. 2405UD65-10]|uniref:DUF5677 domain-containing protein n=1 Tax=Glaciecola sp. 2405UD65-10 TaxID=3397244 RepID=UPI003B5A57EA